MFFVCVRRIKQTDLMKAIELMRTGKKVRVNNNASRLPVPHPTICAPRLLDKKDNLVLTAWEPLVPAFPHRQ